MTDFLQMTVTWAGQRGPTKDGQIVVQFRIPLSEYAQLAQIVYYLNTQIVAIGKWEGYDTDGLPHSYREQLFVGGYGGESRDRDFETVLKIESDVNGVFNDAIAQLVRDTMVQKGSGKTLDLILVRSSDLAEFLRENKSV